MAYLLDANVFIQAKNLHYGFDFCPAFWDWLDREHATGKVHSIEKVGDELQAIGDNLATWAAARGSTFFVVPAPTVLPALTRVSTWVTSQSYAAAAISTFMQVADYYLVGQAIDGAHTIVTHEVPAPTSIRKIKIPDVCIGLGIKCVSPYEMLRAEQARFVL